MFFTFRTGMILLLLQSCCSVSFAMEINDIDCSLGICSFNVLSDHLIPPPCKGLSVIVAYGEATGTTIIQCSSPVEESKILLYNRYGNKKDAYLLEGGRFFDSGSLPTLAAEGVPDKFRPYPLCYKQKPSPWGEVIIGEKTVSGSFDPPYCYLINRINSAGNGLHIVMENGRKLRPLSEAQLKQWTKLRTLLSTYIPQNPAVHSKAGARSGQKAVVQSTKAPLYSSSTPTAKTAKYLVQGDEVTILDSSNDHDWMKVRYITKAGKVIEMWLQARDVK